MQNSDPNDDRNKITTEQIKTMLLIIALTIFMFGLLFMCKREMI